MSKILGIDLGTNSIGLTLREDDMFSWYGVYTFRKGVGEGKSGEFSFAAERTKHRSSRRLYNSRRYRKWETLKMLIEYGFCPLQADNLKNWKNYRKGIGRVFPIDDNAFDKWIKLDFDGDGKPDFSSPYQLRRLLITEKLDLSKEENRYKIGRALYHIAQRRGFKSSRKSGANEKTAVYKGSPETKTIGRNEYENLITENGSLGAAFAHLEDKNIRIRNRYTLRSDYQNEVHRILEFQNLTETNFIKNIDKAIFFQRPLRSQKGLVGKCTLEPNKPRCPISHPKFEEYRAWSFINNIKFRTEDNNQLQSLPLDLKEKLYEEAFFYKSKKELKFGDLRKIIKSNGGKDWELNYSHRMDEISVPSCYVSSRLRAAFGDDWTNFKKTVIRKNKKGEDETIKYTIEEIWHILFSFEDEEYFTEFLESVLELEEEQIKELLILFNSFPVGYANLSLKAINNILPFLRDGLIYSEAVILAKLPELLGEDIFEANKTDIIRALENEIAENRYQKTIVNITNNLIFKYYALDYDEKFGWKNTSYKLDDSDYKEIEIASIEHYGEKTWIQLKDDRKIRLLNDVAVQYQAFFASSKREHIKQPHLVNQIKEFLDNHFNVSQKLLDKIYHPSQIDIYPSKEGQMSLESPKTAAFKNPMAYKTLYKLRDVINYLIEIGKIDNETRIVVEIARDLNDANKRWAIEKYQRDREVENRAFAAAIEELLKESNFSGYANPKSDTDIDKFRIWTEQLENFEEVKTEINSIENNKKISASDKDIMKYRLWKEQNCVCMYTGKMIKLTDLFDKNKVDFEHTIPRSKSFDNSLANLTVCYADYNRNIKKNKLPTELNYEEEKYGYSAIKPRLQAWEKKVEDLFGQIEFWKNKSKRAMDKSEKDNAIRQRHLRQMDYDYWKNKVDRFTRTEIPKGFVNSQLTDTQIITKYAFHYLKTVFNKVDVIKGSQTAEFRKIFGIQPKGEVKNRGKHSHHAIDAAVLTLIPSSRKREEILKDYYYKEENNIKGAYPIKPFADFNYSMIEEIEKNILINNIADKDQTLTPGIKKVRKRGRIVWLRDKDGNLLSDENGNKIPKVAQGDSIRGELHKDTFYGKIKVAEKDEKGSLIRDEKGLIQYKKDLKGKDVFKMVVRKSIDNVNFKSDIIVDEHLAEFLKKQLSEGIKQYELKDFQGNIIRHLRCEAKAGSGVLNPENVTVVKEQTYKSEKEYKNYYYTNTGDNYMFGLYENENGRKIISINVLEASRYSLNKNKDSKGDIFKSIEPVMIGLGKKIKESQLKHIFQTGQKILFFKEDKQELKEMSKAEISSRLYHIKRFHQAERGNIVFQHHLEARNDDELGKEYGTLGKNGFSIDKLTDSFSPPRILFTPNKDVFIIEGKDFEMKLDGSIEFKF